MARAVKKFLGLVSGEQKLLYRSCFFAVCQVKTKAFGSARAYASLWLYLAQAHNSIRLWLVPCLSGASSTLIVRWGAVGKVRLLNIMQVI